MKVLVFDLRESEKVFFEQNSFKDFEFTFFSEKLDKNTKLSDEQFQETDVISVFTSSVLNQDILKKFKNLRIVATRSFEYNHIDLNYCAKNRIAVMNTEQYGEDAVAQYALGLILAIERNMKPAICDLINNSINSSLYEGQLLNNKVLGIIGCGNVGIKLAEIAKMFNMEVLVSSYKETVQFNNYCRVVSFDELLSKSDIIALHMPFSEDNYQILGEEEFSKMKNGVIIINTSCVELISIQALYDNLRSGNVKGAGLDILDNDFLENKKIGNETMNSKGNNDITRELLKMNNVIITPHLAYNTKEYIDYVLKTTINNIRNYQKGMNSNRVC